MTKTDDIEIAVTCEGVRVPASSYLNDTRINRMRESRYEGEEIRGALAVVRGTDRVLEMGAGLGVVGAVVAHNRKPERVISYEANPNMIPVINQLYDANDLSERIEVRNRVLWSSPDRPETVSFFIGNSYLGSSLAQEGSRKSSEIAVETEDFNTLVGDYRPTVLIIDIEGGELDLLRHADLDGVRAVVIEFHPAVYDRAGMRECKTILTDAGFEKQEDLSTRTVWTCTRAS